jgi:uncharacterized protein (TIGR03086 family)
MSINELIDRDARAVAATLAVLEPAPPDLGPATPCAGWTVADLLAHCTVQQHGFARAAVGERTTVADWQPRAQPDPVAAYRAACAEVLAAFAELDGPEAPVHLPEIAPEPIPARVAVGFHLVDNVVHGWDLAAALGRPVALDDDVLAAALSVARAVPDDERRGQPGAPFARALTVPAGTDPRDELLLLLGRDPAWRPGRRDPVTRAR